MKLFIITGTCGAGKSTMKDELAFRLDPNRYACVDSDETGLNWWDYAGTEREGQYGANTFTEAFRIANGRNLVFVTCMAPHDYITKTTVPEDLTATFSIALWARDEIINQRLRPGPRSGASPRMKPSVPTSNTISGSAGTGASISCLSIPRTRRRMKPRKESSPS